MSFEEYLTNIKKMIDELKAMSTALGLANTGNEYKVISELFTYKFLNDKLINDFEVREDKDESFQDFIDFADSKTARITEEYLISSLFQLQNQPDFHETFDKALETISELNKDIYAIETTTGKKKPLFEPLSSYIRDEDKENELAKRAINILHNYKFEGIYENGWDYFSSVFEYLIKDYNKDSGIYAEYFTPVFAGQIIASILYNDTPVNRVSVYDPAAGSGTLLLSMANEIGVDNCTIYSQDISQKSTEFLRINLILNDLTHSLHNVIEGNTLTSPQHLDGNYLKKFDFIVSNPPFNVDFSAELTSLENDKFGRFFAGLPNIPKKDKDGMAIYQTFIQHILVSLSDNKGKAAIVVPTGFLSAKTGIPKKIHEKLIDNNWLRGVISMPSNIFATTGTNVSILFIDKSKADDKVYLMDATSLGETIKLEEGQRTILSPYDKEKIVSFFKKREVENGFAVLVDNKEIREKKYSFSPGQFFETEIEYIEISPEEFNNKMTMYKTNLLNMSKEASELTTKIQKLLGDIEYDF